MSMSHIEKNVELSVRAPIKTVMILFTFDVIMDGQNIGIKMFVENVDGVHN